MFVSNVGPVLTNNITKTHCDILDYMSANSLKSMGINRIIHANSYEIIRIVNILKSSFSKGPDDITSVVTKNVINELSLPL